MKRIICFILLMAIMFSTMTFVSFDAAAEFPLASALGGYENLALAYTFKYTASNRGRLTVDDFMPLTGYKNEQGTVVDYFFDSFLFLPCNGPGPSGARMHSKKDQPTLEIDWKTYVDDTFCVGKNVDALDIAFGKTKEALNDTSDKKVGVFFTILRPNVAAENFGELGGRSLDFSKNDDRKYAIKWIIDEQIKCYNEKNYKNLDLVGFYWLEEYLDISTDYELYIYASDYLHSLGLKFIWIPFYKADGFDQWQDMGFDFVSMQPNNYWKNQSIDDRVKICADYCSKYGMGMELELDSKAYTSGEYFLRYLEYLEIGMKSGAMKSVKSYYHDGYPGVYSFMGNSKDKIPRYLYDITYKYSKGTLTEADFNYDMANEISFKLPEGVNWVSYDKDYTATKPYSAVGTDDYQNVDGYELTDSVIGESDLGTEWYPFYASYNDGQGSMGATLDLGRIYTGLTHFIVHFNNIQNHGIGVPTNIRLYVSNDGNNFNLIAKPFIQKAGIAAYVSFVSSEYITARYVKVSFERSLIGPFVFCSEFLVGEGEPKPYNPYEPSDNPLLDDPEAPDVHSHNDNGAWFYDEVSHWTLCSCGQFLKEGVHVAGDWEILKDPTILEDGSKQCCCVTCGAVVKSEAIPKLDFLIGDANMNDKIDSLDYVIIKRYYFGNYKFNETQHLIADVNRNNEIDSMDYVLVKRIYFGTYK